MWVRNSVTGGMRHVTPTEKKTLDPNRWVPVTGYRAAKKSASKPVSPKAKEPAVKESEAD